MCGIAGVIHLDGSGPPETERVRAMLEAMRHRGPDETAVAASEGATLGNCRLAVVDPERSRQPMGDRASGACLTFNGFVANYRELRAGLEAEGEAFATEGDTEVLLRSLLVRGEGALPALDGMFAFAFHDPRRRATLLARDPCGAKPLYVAEEGRRLLFASEVKGLLAGLPGRPVPDREALLEYLSFQVPLSDRTLFRGVRRLPPGTLLRVAGGRTEESAWWTAPEPDPGLAAGPAAEAVRDALRRSVERCLRADRPVGLLLSGGLDSTAVAAFAAGAGGAGLPAFHGFYDEGPEFDERPHARAAAEALGLPLSEVAVGPAEAGEALPAILRALEEPAAGPGAVGSWFVAREAARRVRVVLGGQGADEVFSGYARHLAVEFGDALRGAVAGDAGTLLGLLPGLGALRGYGPLLGDLFAGEEMLPPAEELFFRAIHRGSALRGVLRGDMARELEMFRPRERFRAAFPGPAAGDLRSRMAEFERRTLLPALLLVEDRTSMAHGLEARVPVLGAEVLAAALRAPPAARREGGGLKPLLRAAAAPVLPAATLARGDKMGFPVPLARWAKGPLRDLLRDLVVDGAARRRGLAEPGAAERALDGAAGAARGLWALLSLELWHRAFTDRAVS